MRAEDEKALPRVCAHRGGEHHQLLDDGAQPPALGRIPHPLLAEGPLRYAPASAIDLALIIRGYDVVDLRVGQRRIGPVGTARQYQANPPAPEPN
ncbi:hypothetical protein [Nitrococcus mobilis]|uniref:Uncharacterized protein n=1 Tax=Nitrococcus mobilis Nb-231 TaxID=314278 RepID=A4BLK5_9GAMM|nr:hypothetical protein [Nitrococcus mobilis]EAR23193.1 hypothetical protein NB231_15273 [Nitrococcus mobilis Nb-231]